MMNKIAMTVIAASLVLSAPVFADDAHHPEQAVGAKSIPAQMMPQVQKMQDNVKMMQTQLDRLGKVKTDAERQKLMTEYMQTMQANMGMAQGMMGGMTGCPMMAGGMMGQGGMGMMGGGAMGGGMGMMGQGATGTGDMMAKRLEMMEKRMDMMQMMMQGQTGMPRGGQTKPAN